MANEHARSSDRMGIDVQTGLAEGGRESGGFRVDKWDSDQISWVIRHDYEDARLLRPGQEPKAPHFYNYGCTPFEVYRAEDCNLITAAGWGVALNSKNWLNAGSIAATFFDTTHGRIGLGTGSTTPTYNDTALTAIGALTVANWVLCGAAPTYTAATGSTPASFVFTATFGTTQANGVAIQEFAIDQGTANALTVTGAGMGVTVPGMANHGLAAPGTKTSAQTWNVTATLQFS